MKLLIITQVVDTEHSVLGFFHRWIAEFAKHCEHVHVIALQVGQHNLPANVTVHSLGKEQHLRKRCGLKEERSDGERSFLEEQISNLVIKLRYTTRFYRLIWQLRHDYDNVFVHMNQIYVILGAAFWRATGKRVGLWYAHGAVTATLYVSVLVANIIFTSTPQGMRVRTSKRAIVGQGIDPVQFLSAGHTADSTLQLITIGRVSSSKNIDTLLRAVSSLKQNDIAFQFKIIGGTSTPTEATYAKQMQLLATELNLEQEVIWVGPLPHDQLPAQLQSADLFIHDGSTNSLDKTLVEASFAGCVVISSNPSYRGLTESIAPELLFAPKDHQALAAIIIAQHTNPTPQAAQVRTELLQTCSLPGLVSGIVARYKSKLWKD